MDILALFDAVSNAARDTRSKYQMTLGRAIKDLSAYPGESVIRFPDGQYPGNVDSYRGYYADLSVEPRQDVSTVAELLEELKLSVGGVFTGYKGGEYTMGEDTPLWTAPYGTTGPAIMDFVAIGDYVLIVTKEID